MKSIIIKTEYVSDESKSQWIQNPHILNLCVDK